jgi:tRNA pseudouridine38-40 synthase
VRTYRLTIAYDGTNYAGWQRQVNGVSIQQLVEEAFAPLVGGVAPTVSGASRTDAGVHAIGQVASVNADIELEPIAVLRALNVKLPYDIRVTHAEVAAPGFHARFHARAKTYRYRMITTSVMPPLDRLYAWHAPGPKNLGLMRAAAALLVGTHDFASFQGRGAFVRATERTIHRLDVGARDAAGEDLEIVVEGDGFLRHMVRTIAGTLAEIGGGGRPVASMAGILEARDRRAAGVTSPACGLTLMSVAY